MILANCLRYWFSRYGEPFVAGGQVRRGIFTQPPSDLLRWQFSPDELNSLPRPIWMVAHLPEVLLLPNDTLTWRGEVYLVLRRLEFVVRNDPLYRIALIVRFVAP